MMKIKYRVILKVSYNDAFFDFDCAEDACKFAITALEHSATSEDQKKVPKVTIEVINPNPESEDE